MNTPNKLTIARMIIVPFLVIFLLTGWGGEANRYISLTLFVVASVTDWFDGYLARKNNLVTNFGKFMDPLADKLLVCSAMICMIDLKRLPAWFVIIIIAREFMVSPGVPQLQLCHPPASLSYRGSAARYLPLFLADSDENWCQKTTPLPSDCFPDFL